MSISSRETGSMSRTSWLGLPIGILLGAIWLNPALVERRAISAKIEQRLVWLDHLQQGALQLDVLRQQTLEFLPVVEDAAVILPDRFDDEGLRAGLRQSAIAHGLRLNRLELGAERNLIFYAEMSVELELFGPASAVLAWVDQELRSNPLRVVDTLQLTADAGRNLSAKLRWRYFRYASFDDDHHLEDAHGH